MNTKTVAIAWILAALALPGIAHAVSAAEPWFTTTNVADGVWRIDDHGGDNMYLVAGDGKALLIDTGLGIGDAMKIVRTLTPLPVIVVNTHGHPDHAGGNYQFAEVFAHPADFDMITTFNRKAYRANTRANGLKNAQVDEAQLYPEPDGEPMAKMIPVKAGHVFDLGGKQLEVVEVPGHTLGGICLLDKRLKLLFSGDNNNTVQWQFLDTSTTLEKYVATLETENARSDFDTLLPGHGPALEKSFISEQMACAKTILDGSCKDEPYKTFAGEARICECGKASIAFDPNKLR